MNTLAKLYGPISIANGLCITFRDDDDDEHVSFFTCLTVCQKSVQLLAYADDIDIIGRTKRDVTAAFGAIERESTKMGPGS